MALGMLADGRVQSGAFESDSLFEKPPPPYSQGAPEILTNDDRSEELAQSASAMPTNAPVKSYNVTNNHTFSQIHFEIQQNGKTIYWVNTVRKFFQKPQINIHTTSENGPIIASCRLESWSRKLRFHLGNPDCTDKDTWPIAECSGFTEKAYSFNVGTAKYEWRRTHNEQLGASTFGNKSFKLVDLADGKILAAHVWRRGFTRRHEVARIDYYVELCPELELGSLAVVHGIEERIREAERSSSGGGGGCGA